MAAKSKPENARARKPLTQERLKELLHYDPETGEFRWRISRPGARAGSLAGSPTKRGRVKMRVDYAYFFAHQLAWFYMTGQWVVQIDHRDLDQANNRFVNLRVADPSSNGANKRKQQMPWQMTSRLKGVYADRNGKWSARICCQGKRYFLGNHETEELAHAAYAAKAKELFGEYARIE